MDLPGFTDQWQTERQQLFKSVPPEGRKVRYLEAVRSATHNARMHGICAPAAASISCNRISARSRP